MAAENPYPIDAGAAAASGAAAPSEAATQVASDGAPAPEADHASGFGPSPVEQPEAPLVEVSESVVDDLVARAEKADEYLLLAQRTKADFENYKKRALRDAAAAQTRGVIKLTRELLPAIDNLDRALAAASATDAGDLAAGIKLVYDELVAALGRAGIDPFSPEGEQFDPQHHEAVAHHPVQGAEPGTIVEVYQRGYRLGDAVIRPARVAVAG